MRLPSAQRPVAPPAVSPASRRQPPAAGPPSRGASGRSRRGRRTGRRPCGSAPARTCCGNGADAHRQLPQASRVRTGDPSASRRHPRPAASPVQPGDQGPCPAFSGLTAPPGAATSPGRRPRSRLPHGSRRPGLPKHGGARRPVGATALLAGPRPGHRRRPVPVDARPLPEAAGRARRRPGHAARAATRPLARAIDGVPGRGERVPPAPCPPASTRRLSRVAVSSGPPAVGPRPPQPNDQRRAGRWPARRCRLRRPEWHRPSRTLDPGAVAVCERAGPPRPRRVGGRSTAPGAGAATRRPRLRAAAPADTSGQRPSGGRRPAPWPSAIAAVPAARPRCVDAAPAAGAGRQAAAGAPRAQPRRPRRLTSWRASCSSPLAARLKAELRLDRERGGLLTDLRHRQ